MQRTLLFMLSAWAAEIVHAQEDNTSTSDYSGSIDTLTYGTPTGSLTTLAPAYLPIPPEQASITTYSPLGGDPQTLTLVDCNKLSAAQGVTVSDYNYILDGQTIRAPDVFDNGSGSCAFLPTPTLASAGGAGSAISDANPTEDTILLSATSNAGDPYTVSQVSTTITVNTLPPNPNVTATTFIGTLSRNPLSSLSAPTTLPAAYSPIPPESAGITTVSGFNGDPTTLTLVPCTALSSAVGVNLTDYNYLLNGNVNRQPNIYSDTNDNCAFLPPPTPAPSGATTGIQSVGVPLPTSDNLLPTIPANGSGSSASASSPVPYEGAASGLDVVSALGGVSLASLIALAVL